MAPGLLVGLEKLFVTGEPRDLLQDMSVFGTSASPLRVGSIWAPHLSVRASGRQLLPQRIASPFHGSVSVWKAGYS